jgi:uncharacterized protein YbjT (DUF2867 family)
VVAGDVDDLTALGAGLDGCQGIHLSLHGEMDPDLERRGAVNVAKLAGAAGVHRITYLSGASVCAENCWFRDTKARWEAEAALRSSGVPWSIFRATFFMETLHHFVRGKMAIVPGKQPLRFHFLAAADFARMVSRAFALPEAANRTFYAYGPNAYTMREALQVYCRIAHPEVRIVQLPLWVLSVIAWAGRRTQLKEVLPFFRYLQKIDLRDDQGEANALFGPATITLEEWSRQEAVGLAPVTVVGGATHA